MRRPQPNSLVAMFVTCLASACARAVQQAAACGAMLTRRAAHATHGRDAAAVENLVNLFAEHGLLAVFLGVFIEQIGVPTPALPFFVLAGARAAGDGPFALKALVAGTAAALIADACWYFAGRRFGRGVLSLLCRISLSPDTCVRKSEASFVRRGAATVLLAKFLPGISLLAPPLAGALGMRLPLFLILDVAGSLLWGASGVALGFIFHREVQGVLVRLADLGGQAAAVLAGAVSLYVMFRLWRRLNVARLLKAAPRIEVQELAQRIESGEPLVILDVRQWASEPDASESIPGARPVTFDQLDVITFPATGADHPIVTFCDCPDDASAVRAAMLLRKRGWQARALRGGYQSWASQRPPA
jgi:membrane protein DedA with SNARE-associated domain/rhodanese-related sulfurtransferase